MITQDGNSPSVVNAIPDVVCATATGTAATDTANLQAAINATPSGGRLYIPKGTYQINAALIVAASITIEGDAAGPTYTTVTSGGNPTYPSSPGVGGTVIEQTAAGTDIIDITGSAVSVHLKGLGLLFANGLASTGHGINASPTQTYGGGHDMGVTDFVWERLYVFGHDGNHWAYRLLNPQYGTLIQCRSYGGGGFAVVCDAGAINAGNLAFIHPISVIFNNGTADGFTHSSAVSSGSPGLLNLITYTRPQAIFTQGANQQRPYNDLAGAGIPQMIEIFAPDFEGAGASNREQVGSGTTIVGTPYITGPNASRWNQNTGSYTAGSQAGGNLTNNTGAATCVGTSAAAAATTAGGLTAIGSQAAAAVTTAGNVTAIGQGALQYNTGANNTALGTSALQGPSGGSSGTSNTAVGNNALAALTTGGSNSVVGRSAAVALTTGSNNVANGASALAAVQTGSNNTALGYQALTVATGSNLVAVGAQAFASLTSGGGTAIGYQAGYAPNGVTGNASVTADNNTFVGSQTGDGSSSNHSKMTCVGSLALGNGHYATSLGYKASAGATGAVAIGTDSGGTGASTTTANVIALGTANHKVQLANNTTGAGSAALGSNCPAVTASAPYTWFTMMSSDGSTVYVPAWK